MQPQMAMRHLGGKPRCRKSGFVRQDSKGFLCVLLQPIMQQVLSAETRTCSKACFSFIRPVFTRNCTRCCISDAESQAEREQQILSKLLIRSKLHELRETMSWTCYSAAAQSIQRASIAADNSGACHRKKFGRKEPIRLKISPISEISIPNP